MGWGGWYGGAAGEMRLLGAADDGKINDEGMALRKAEEAGEFSPPFLPRSSPATRFAFSVAMLRACVIFCVFAVAPVSEWR